MGRSIEKSPKFTLRFQVMVAEVEGEVRVPRDFPADPRTFLQMAGEEVSIGPPLLLMKGEVVFSPTLNLFRDVEVEGCDL